MFSCLWKWDAGSSKPWLQTCAIKLAQAASAKHCFWWKEKWDHRGKDPSAFDYRSENLGWNISSLCGIEPWNAWQCPYHWASAQFTMPNVFCSMMYHLYLECVRNITSLVLWACEWDIVSSQSGQLTRNLIIFLNNLLLLCSMAVLLGRPNIFLFVSILLLNDLSAYFIHALTWWFSLIILGWHGSEAVSADTQWGWSLHLQ